MVRTVARIQLGQKKRRHCVYKKARSTLAVKCERQLPQALVAVINVPRINKLKRRGNNTRISTFSKQNLWGEEDCKTANVATLDYYKYHKVVLKYYSGFSYRNI